MLSHVVLHCLMLSCVAVLCCLMLSYVVATAVFWGSPLNLQFSFSPLLFGAGTASVTALLTSLRGDYQTAVASLLSGENGVVLECLENARFRVRLPRLATLQELKALVALFLNPRVDLNKVRLRR